MFALFAAVLLFIMAIVQVAFEAPLGVSSAMFLLALGFWALHFAIPITVWPPVERRRQ